MGVQGKCPSPLSNLPASGSRARVEFPEHSEPQAWVRQQIPGAEVGGTAELHGEQN